MKNRASTFAIVVAAGLFSALPAQAQVIFSDGFESYPVGTFVPPTVNGWTDFGGSQPITISTTQAHTGNNSVRLAEGASSGGGYGSDLFRDFLPSGVISGGKYNFSYWQFIEPGVDTVSFMYTSTGRIGSINFQTGLDLRSSSSTAGNSAGTNLLVVQDIGGSATLMTAPVASVFGAWAEYSMFIDLDNNLYNLSYNGAPLINGLQWDTTPGDGVTLGGFNFWMQLGNVNNTTNFVYFDDFTLTVVPEPSAMLLTPIGALLWKWRRRKTAV